MRIAAARKRQWRRAAAKVIQAFRSRRSQASRRAIEKGGARARAATLRQAPEAQALRDASSAACRASSSSSRTTCGQKASASSSCSKGATRPARAAPSPAFLEHMNPRHARAVALTKPSDVERGQWYFQRYIAHLPTAGDIVLFDRSWYNRAGVERVMGFCSQDEVANFLRDAPDFEELLVRDGVQALQVLSDAGTRDAARALPRAAATIPSSAGSSRPSTWRPSPSGTTTRARKPRCSVSRTPPRARGRWCAPTTSAAPALEADPRGAERARLRTARIAKLVGKPDPLIVELRAPTSSRRLTVLASRLARIAWLTRRCDASCRNRGQAASFARRRGRVQAGTSRSVGGVLPVQSDVATGRGACHEAYVRLRHAGSKPAARRALPVSPSPPRSFSSCGPAPGRVRQASPEPLYLLGIPVDFILFALTLLGVALFHHYTLQVALAGLAAIVGLQARASPASSSVRASAASRCHMQHEWVILANLFLLLMGFALLSRHFEKSRLPDVMPAYPARRLEGRLRCCW